MARATARKKSTRPKGKKPAASLAPTTKKQAVGQRNNIIFIQSRPAGVRVTEETALTLGAVWACVKVITEDIAGLPWCVKQKRPGGGSDDVENDPADWIIGTQASPEMPAFQFREAIIAHALCWGNGYAEIERDGAGRPLWLWLLTPDRVRPKRASDNRVIYEVSNPFGEPTILELEDVFHLKGLGFDGLIGYSVIQMAARSIGTGIALDQSTSDIFGNDSTPGGVLKMQGRLSEDARKRLASDWDRRHQGPGNRRRVAILEEGMEWSQTGLPPEDTKLIEQRQFTPADICRWFRVSPVKIQDLLRATFSNIEELSIWHTTDALMPWIRRLETEANIKLFGRTNRGKRFTKINHNALLRGKTAERWAAYTQGLDRGVLCVNDVLELEDRNPIGPDGDKRFVPLNMQLLEKAGEDPPAPPQPPGNPPDPGGNPKQPDPNPSEPNAPLRKAMRPVFEDACRRLLLRERDRARTALATKNGDFAAWLAKIETEHTAYVRDVFRPPVSALALANKLDANALDAALGIVAENHVEGFKSRIVLAASRPASVADWEQLAGDMAASLIAQAFAACGVAAVTAEPEPAPPSVVVNAPVTVNMPEQKPQTFNLTMPEQKPHAVTVNVPPYPDQPAPIVNVSVPEQPAPVVNVAPAVVNLAVPEQTAPVVNVAPAVVNVSAPEQLAPVINNVVNIPEQKSPDVRIENKVSVPEQLPPVVNVAAGSAPIVNLTVPEQLPPSITNVVNVPEQKPATVQVNVPEAKAKKKKAKKLKDGSWEIEES